MNKNNLKICILTITVGLIGLGLFSSGSFNISNSIYLLTEASAQVTTSPISQYILSGYDLSSSLFGVDGINPWTKPTGSIGLNYYNLSNIFPLPPYVNTSTQSGLYQLSNIYLSSPFGPMTFAPGNLYTVNLPPTFVSQKVIPLTLSSPMFGPLVTAYQWNNTSWMTYYPQPTTQWATSSQPVLNITPWNIYQTYIPTIPEESSEILVAKPAIYLYPEDDTNLTVYLDFNGQITQTDPDYQGGWNVFVTVTENSTTEYSTIYDENGSAYDYLFWEGTFDHNLLALPSKGWIIAQENLEAWFDVNLNALGLNNKEKQQFVEYWLARLQDSPYYEIKLVDQEVINNNATLSITTSDGSVPDTMIRIIIHFHGLDVYQSIEAQVIVTPERYGFVVVEWGGILY